VEIEVKAHRRRLHRRRYRPTCACGAHPGLVTAPPPPRLIPKSPFGVSVWVTVLLDKDLFYRPPYRLLADLRSHGRALSQGALPGGLQRLRPLVAPLSEALVERSQQPPLGHADETRWRGFATVAGKVGSRWYLWVLPSTEAVVFVLAAGRAPDVPQEHLEPVEPGMLVVDRFQAYQAIDQVKAGLILLAFGGAHPRRDFREVARSWPAQQDGAWGWVVRIRALDPLHARRLAVRADSEAFEPRDRDLRAAVDPMAAQAAAALAEPPLPPARRKALESLDDPGTGLTGFGEHPAVPMDHNPAARAERGPVRGRKNYYGSGAVWAGRLAAMRFARGQTLSLGKLNPRWWRTADRTACAESGGPAPADVSV
jgi:transposase